MEIAPDSRPRTWETAFPIVIAGLLALVVVLPPKYLAVSVILFGAGAAVWGMTFHRNLVTKPPALVIVALLALAAGFCLLGVFPISQRTDIQPEFLKYTVYAAAFLIGFIAIGRQEQRNAFVTATIATVIAFFVATILTAGETFHINQSWALYPPDQNNSVSILAPLSVAVLTFKPRWARIVLLVLLFLLFTFAESRLGVIIMFGVAFAQLLLDRRAGIAVLVVCMAIAAAFSLSGVGAQTTVMRAVSGPPNPETTHSDSRAESSEPRVSLNRVVEFGTFSDRTRIKIYRRAINVSARLFPNLVGMGDAAVVDMLNTPRIDRLNVFQHAHNFILQSYLAYGLLATLCIIGAAVAIVVISIRYRNWMLLSALILIGAIGMIEALISDVRVLTVLAIFIGSSIAECLRREGVEPEARQGA